LNEALIAVINVSGVVGGTDYWRNDTKHRIKSYGTTLVKVRWNFSDEALWNRVRPLICSEGRRYANRCLD
jgi:hypothetical protein